jgi:hypothetical protein
MRTTSGFAVSIAHAQRGSAAAVSAVCKNGLRLSFVRAII